MSEGRNTLAMSLSLMFTFLAAGTFVYFVVKRGHENDVQAQQNQIIYLEEDSETAHQQALQYEQVHQLSKAIDQLTLSIALNENNDLARQDLARLYMTRCIASNQYCAEARWLYDYLIDKYEEDAKLYESRSKLLFHLGDTAASNRDHKRFQELKLKNRIWELDEE